VRLQVYNNVMSKSITFDVTEPEAASLEAAIDRALASLQWLDSEEDKARQERIKLLQAETQTFIRETKKLLNVEEVL